jgi:hypothetical protein
MIEVTLESGIAPPARGLGSMRPEPSPQRARDGRGSEVAPLRARIAGAYREMPGLSLTAAQAARLWSVERAACVAALQALVAEGRLRRTREPRYSVAGHLESVWRSAR